MKKSFYFALALTAGLFASCSSDDISKAPQQPNVNFSDTELAQISIKVDAPNATTRGTGSVQGTTWGGQSFNLFMLDKGTFKPTQYVPSVGQASVDIYNNTEMTTTAGSTIANQVLDGGVIQYQYFPSNGRFDFWGYRIDDAWVDDAGKAGWEDGADATKKVVEGLAAYTAGATTYTWAAYTGTDDATLNGDADPTTATVGTQGAIYQNTQSGDKFECTAVNAAAGSYTDDDAVTQVLVPFKIDGSQDLMIAETKTAKAAEDLIASPQYTGSDEDAPSYIYSAYAARRGVNPEMTFKHQLVRLQFKVKAASRDVSNLADPKLAVGTTNAAGDEYYAGFKVTKVEVWSKNTGKLIVAYKGNTAPESRITWDDGQDWVARDANDAWIGTTTLTPFELKSRETETEKADIIMQEVGLNATATVTPPAGYEYNGATAGVVPNTLSAEPCYTIGTLDPETGEPMVAATTFDAARGLTAPPATVFMAFVKSGVHPSDGTTKWDKAIITSDPSKKLVALKPVVPKWSDNYRPASGGTPTWEEYAGAPKADGYVWTECAAVATPTAVVTAAPTPTTSGYSVGDVVKYTDPTFNEHYYELTDIHLDTEGAPQYTGTSNPVDDNAGALAGTTPVGTIVWIEDPADATKKIYYHVYAAGGNEEVPGEGVATTIGESMLVAPADDNGYLVRFSYTRCKMINADNFVDMPGEAIINVKTSAGKQFTASKFYTVTAILYSDGEIKFEGGDIEEQDDGTGDLDDNNEGYGLEN